MRFENAKHFLHIDLYARVTAIPFGERRLNGTSCLLRKQWCLPPTVGWRIAEAANLLLSPFSNLFSTASKIFRHYSLFIIHYSLFISPPAAGTNLNNKNPPFGGSLFIHAFPLLRLCRNPYTPSCLRGGAGARSRPYRKGAPLPLGTA